jgi:hypothetical protein
MAKKTIVFNNQVESIDALADKLREAPSFTSTQVAVVTAVARGLMPCQVRIDQRTHKGAINVCVTGPNGARVFNLSPRAKMREFF